MEKVYLGLGGNLGDRMRFLRDAAALLQETADARVEACSPVYETSPVGGPRQPPYLNAVVQIKTSLWPGELLAHIHKIEARLKRRRRTRWGPRTIDIDILLWGRRVLRTATLAVPHPRMTERLFVLRPLLDLAPDLTDPTTGRRFAEFLSAGGFEGQECRLFSDGL